MKKSIIFGTPTNHHLMHTCYKVLLVAIAISATGAAVQAGQLQQKDSIPSQPVSSRYLTAVADKAGDLEQKLGRKSQKALQQFQKQEARIKRKLARIDLLKAAQVFGSLPAGQAGAEQQYKQLEQKLQAGKLKQYIPSLDTLVTSLKFLEQNPQLLPKAAQAKLKEAIGKVSGLQGQFQKAEEIKKFLKERRQYLKDQLSRLNIGRFGKELKQLNKQAYYYSRQLNEYKALLKDHKKAEKKALELLSKTKLFKDFMRKNSQLASLFRLPGNPNDPTTPVSLAGLQTRVQVNNLIQQQIAAGGPGARQQLQQNLQQAQGQLNELKNKMSQFGAGSSDAEMPEGFKPNNQKTKSFLQRLELGTNIQSQKANGYFPVTSDIGLSLGYKLNDKSIIGIGASYKLGLGKDIRHIDITHQGAGLRSFVDWKVKGSWWISGGYEMNYRSRFSSITQLQNINSWQQSGLVGVSKVVSLKTKFFKKTKLQLLWDFMSYQQAPKAQPVVFRVGYQF